MADDTNSSPSETQRATDVSPQRGVPNEDAASQRDTAGEEIRDPEKKRLHEEAVAHKKRAKDLEARLKAYEDAEEAKRLAALDDVERSKAEVTKAEKRIAEAEAKSKEYQKQLVTAQVKLAAQSKGIIDPDMAALAVQSSLEFGDDGMPTNLEKALDTLIKNKPYLRPTEPETPPASPAQTAPAPASPPPTLPPFGMNGRTSIGQPAARPPGSKPPRLTDQGIFSAPGTLRQDRA